MNTEQYVSIEHLCVHYEVERTLFEHMTAYGLIDISLYDNEPAIALEHIADVEKIIRLYHDLEVNMEGIDVVLNLLKKISELQLKLSNAQNRLQLYEG
ncbi:MAG: hypothetical protein IT257_01465 [Chitinophagaceae bacterium]|nr:hypothetical protein [Chitinophagaceae bacterium]